MEIIIKCSDDVRGGVNIYGEPIEEVIRCKECRFFDGDEWCYEWGENRVREDDFCSYAERKGADDE